MRSGTNGSDKIGKGPLCRLLPMPLSEPRPRPGKDETGTSQRILLAQEQVRGQVLRRPRGEDGPGVRPKSLEQVAQMRPLSAVEEDPTHPTSVDIDSGMRVPGARRPASGLSLINEMVPYQRDGALSARSCL